MKTFVVIGGSSGIGLSVSNGLAKDGHTVEVYSRSTSDAFVEGINHHPFDVLEDTYTPELEQVDGLVYCPGSINLKPFQSLGADDFINDFNINVAGAVKSIQAFLKPLKKGDNASIVLYSTVAVAQGMPFHASVAAAKGAVEGLTKSLAAELSPKIRVNCIAPSITDTPLASKLLSSDDKKEKSAVRHPLKRVGTPEDIAAMTRVLLSDDASWITGQIIGIDGGMSTLKLL